MRQINNDGQARSVQADEGNLTGQIFTNTSTKNKYKKYRYLTGGAREGIMRLIMMVSRPTVSEG